MNILLKKRFNDISSLSKRLIILFFILIFTQQSIAQIHITEGTYLYISNETQITIVSDETIQLNSDKNIVFTSDNINELTEKKSKNQKKQDLSAPTKIVKSEPEKVKKDLQLPALLKSTNSNNQRISNYKHKSVSIQTKLSNYKYINLFEYKVTLTWFITPKSHTDMEVIFSIKDIYEYCAFLRAPPNYIA